MASFFSKLPLEIRNQIYGELLVSKEESIAIQGRCPTKEELQSRKDNSRKPFSSPDLFFRDTMRNFKEKPISLSAAFGYTTNDQPGQMWKCDPTILQVCKQTNHEASTVFYSANRFRYDFCKPCTHEPDDQYCEADFLDRMDVVPHLDRIRNLEIAYHGFSEVVGFSWRPTTRPPYEIENLLSIFAHIAGLGCKIQTLRLTLEMDERPSYLFKWLLPGPEGLYMITRDDALRQAVTELEVKDKVEIVLSTKRADDDWVMEKYAPDLAKEKRLKAENDGISTYGWELEDFAQDVAKSKGWKVEHDVTTTWVLRPIVKRAA